MKPHQLSPRQLSLLLDAAGASPDQLERWRDGACLAYLGGSIALTLDTDQKTAVRIDRVLHLPLPPGASLRQIQDAAEAWLRQEATQLIGAAIARQVLRLGCAAPRWALSFAARASWAQPDRSGVLRCNWRLIEQPEDMIEQVIGRAISSSAKICVAETGDLWGLTAT